VAVETRFTSEAEEDIQQAHDWYDQRRPGLGLEFLAALEGTIESLVRMPEMCPVTHDGCRRALLRRFPYSVFYIYDSGLITVVAVFHHSRPAEQWTNRLA
jgi:plasmid stabilization system protein ParE